MSLIALTLSLLSLQTPQAVVGDPNDVTMQNAVVQMATSPTLFLQLNGSISYRGVTTPIVSNLAWSSSMTGSVLTQQVDLESYVNGALVKRVVGDGDTLWSYNVSLHQYSATRYGGTPGLVRPDHYTSHLLNDLNWAASGADGYLTKLLRQVYNPSNPTYSSWMPGVLSTQLLFAPQADPINPSVVYEPSAINNFFLYDATPKRTIVIEVAQGTASNPGSAPISGIENVYFNQLETVARYDRLTQWVITPYPSFTFTTALFVPYSGKDIAGWRPVVAPKPVSE